MTKYSDGSELYRQKLFDKHFYPTFICFNRTACVMGRMDHIMTSQRIMPNARETGYQAAQLLDRMMKGESVPPELRWIEPCDLKTRQSTDVIAVDDKLVSEAVRFIRNNAASDIKVEDILRVVPLSRRVLESRFRKALGHSPHDEIIRVKMKMIKEMLVETDLTLPFVAERCGFKHEEYLSFLFKKHTGLSPGLYRLQNQRKS